MCRFKVAVIKQESWQGFLKKSVSRHWFSLKYDRLLLVLILACSADKNIKKGQFWRSLRITTYAYTYELISNSPHGTGSHLNTRLLVVRKLYLFAIKPTVITWFWIQDVLWLDTSAFLLIMADSFTLWSHFDICMHLNHGIWNSYRFSEFKSFQLAYFTIIAGHRTKQGVERKLRRTVPALSFDIGFRFLLSNMVQGWA